MLLRIGDDKKNIHAFSWELYTKENEDLINREFLVSVPHTKGGNIVWTCVKDNTIKEKEKCKAIRICVFDYKLFEV